MANWRDSILKHFKPKVSRLTLVADPDGLLTEEGMLSAIRERGFDLIPFDDSISFRYAYESQYRSQWDKRKKTDLVVVLRSSEQQLDNLPFDLLRAGVHLSFALHQLFPKLNYSVIEKVDRSLLDAIAQAYPSIDGSSLSERETKDFVLMHCFRIVAALISTPVDLMKVLLSIHSRNVQLPDLLVDHLQQSLKNNSKFADWPMPSILKSRDHFLRFVQDEWKGFLAGFAPREVGGEGAHGGPHSMVSESRSFTEKGSDPENTQHPMGRSGFRGLTPFPVRIPFEHEDIRAYVDTLFLEGSLSPIVAFGVDAVPAWAHVGIRQDAQGDAVRRYHGLKKTFEASIPGPDASHKEWQQAGQRWAELIVLRWEWDQALSDEDRSSWASLHASVENQFGKWMMQRYGSLYNLPYQQSPVMVHQISRYMAFERNRKKHSKIALVVLDGLALDQWLLLKKSLESTDSTWRFHESSAFAWVPTLTTVTRQTIFAGEPPLFFSDSLATTTKEKSHWLRFWEDQGVKRASVDLVTNLDGPTDPSLEAALENHQLAVLGVIWNKVDNIMHGMQLQTAGMHNQVRLWASQGHLQQLLLRLSQDGFVIYLTADHGNVTAEGIGNPKEGVLVETKGKRVRVYDNVEFLDEVAAKFPESQRWNNQGLPPSRYVLFPGNLKAFTNEGDQVVSHGGISMEEVLVPFVTITREGP